ncbi:MAG: amidohydrolase family protein [Asgard group archaeon]|nr:amidohydrolase family protein [Asgard group archaeon]
MTSFKHKKLLDQYRAVETKYQGPKFDAHVHITAPNATHEMVEIGKEFHIQKSVGIIKDAKKPFEEYFPKYFIFARFIYSRNLFYDKIEQVINGVDKIAADGIPIVKFWHAPRWIDRIDATKIDEAKRYRIDDPRFAPVFDRMVNHNLVLLIHVSDPDLYYKIKYQPESRYGKKAQHLAQLEGILKRHLSLNVLAAHFAGQPEHLEQLSTWLHKYPNLYIDTASAKWMARSFASQTHQARAFFQEFQDRILFGTDIVSGRKDREPLPDYYYNRYFTYQALFETAVKNLPLPIPDPENNNETIVNGLDLPHSVLQRIYWENGKELFQF